MKLFKFRELALSLLSFLVLLYILLGMRSDDLLKYTIVIIVTAISGIWFVYSIISLLKRSK